MFPLTRSSRLAQRALDALHVAHSFLLLEDDYDIDWEVDQDEPTRVSHPHRAPLRGRPIPRRAGLVPARPQACLAPVGHVTHAPGGERKRRRVENVTPSPARNTPESGH
jgi:hypothetical protein